MKFIRSLLCCVVIFSAYDVYAGVYTSTVDTLWIKSDGGVRIYLDSDHTCGSNVIDFDESAPGFLRVYTALLAYQAQGKKVRFYYTCKDEVEAEFSSMMNAE